MTLKHLSEYKKALLLCALILGATKNESDTTKKRGTRLPEISGYIISKMGGYCWKSSPTYWSCINDKFQVKLKNNITDIYKMNVFYSVYLR